MTDGTLPPPPKKAKKKKHKIHHRRPSAVSSGATRSEINVTPLVDVVLVLLIIFMVVTPMLHRGVHVTLPETVHHDQKQDTGEQLIVSVNSTGIYIDTDRVGDTPEVGKDAKPIAQADQEALIARVKKELHDGSRPAFVRADKSLKYGQVRYVLQQIHNAGASMVSMQTEEQK
ncbi:MAG: biopolymer transporter ExbD [Polyangia bacterium]